MKGKEAPFPGAICVPRPYQKYLDILGDIQDSETFKNNRNIQRFFQLSPVIFLAIFLNNSQFCARQRFPSLFLKQK